MGSVNALIVDKLLLGKSIKESVQESERLFYNSGDWENISNETELMSFNGSIASFSPGIRIESETPEYTEYSFEIYCPDLIGTVYDAEDPHPLKVTVYSKEMLSGKDLKKSFDTGSDIRDFLKYVMAQSEHVFKSMKIEKGW